MNQQVEIQDPEQGHRDFWGVVRLYDIDDRYENQVLPALYAQNTVFAHTHHGPTVSVDESSNELEEQRDLGVMINHTWSAQGNRACLAQYCGFQDIQDLTVYVDMIVPDIVHEAAFIASNPVRVNNGILSGDISTFQKFMKRNDFYNLGGPRHIGWVGQFDFADKFVKPRPVELLQAYQNNQEIRHFVDQVVKYCPKPTFVPARNWHLRQGRNDIFQDEKKKVHPEAFVLAHAVQLLLFAPQDWRTVRVYSRDMAQYEHRFPTPEFIGGGTANVVAGLFSMEDLHRAILLFYYLIHRRKQVDWIGNLPGNNRVRFAGYHRPAAEANDDDAGHPDDDDRVQTNTFVSQPIRYCVIL